MPRRSDADLSIVPMVPGRGRPEPPKALDPIEARAWNDSLTRCRDNGSTLPARSSCAARPLKWRSPRGLRPAFVISRPWGHPEALAAVAELAVMHRATSKSVIACLTALRATPRSRMAAREGRAKFERGPAFRPWEIVAKRSDGQP